MKKQAMKFLANSLVLAGLLTVNVSQAGTDEEVAAIAAVRDAELATVNEGNAANVANVYAADVEFMPPDEPTLSGADAVAAWHAAVFAEYDLDLQYTAADVKVFGDWAVEQYAGNVVITPKAGGDAATATTRGIHVYHRDADGNWKITHDLWNHGPSPAAAE